MIIKKILRDILKAKEKELSSYDYGIPREKLKEIDLSLPFAIVISGIRRCGKSTLMRQVMKKMKEKYYFDFEDNRVVDFEISDFQKLDEIFEEEYGKSEFYFFDEIQNVEKWELFVRSKLDKKKHFLITGSNSSLLSKELGTRLTGRHITYELFPFSFKEFLEFTENEESVESFGQYFQRGGFPEYLKYRKKEILHELFKDIIVRDIAARHGIRNIKTIKEIALYLFTNIGKEFTYNNLKKTFSLGSTNTAISFVSHLEDSYLIFTIPKFDYSLKKQQVNAKKVYAIDTGLCSANSLSFSYDKGRKFENLVFVGLRRKYKEIFYFKENKECDFLVKEKGKITGAYQACYELNDDNKKREIEGLIEALEKFKLNEGLILTYNQEDRLKISKKKIVVKPLWKWLLEK